MRGRMGQTPSWILLLSLSVALAWTGCGDPDLVRNVIDENEAPPTRPGSDTTQPKGDAGTQLDSGEIEDNEEWLENQDEVIVPWAEEIDNDLVSEGVWTENTVIFPIEGNEHLLELEHNSIIYNLDPKWAFIFRIKGIELEDTTILFYFERAGIEELYIRLMVYDKAALDDDDDETRQQGLLGSAIREGVGIEEPFSFDISPFSFKGGLCTTVLGFDTGSSNQDRFWRPCADTPSELATARQVLLDEIANQNTPPQPPLDDGDGEADTEQGCLLHCNPDGTPGPAPAGVPESGPPDPAITHEPPQHSGGLEVGLVIEVAPNIGVLIEDVRLRANIGGRPVALNHRYSGRPGTGLCACYVRHYDNYNASTCGDERGFHDFTIDILRDQCRGFVRDFELYFASQVQITLKDLEFKFYAKLDYNAKFFRMTFKRIPFMLGPVPMLFTIGFDANFKASVEGQGVLSYKGLQAPGFQLNPEFGLRYPDDQGLPNWQRFSEDRDIEEYQADAPHLIGRLSFDTELSFGPFAKLAIAGVAGPTFSPIIGYGQAHASIQHNRTTGVTTCDAYLAAGVRGKMGFEAGISILGFSIFQISGDFDLYDTCKSWRRVNQHFPPTEEPKPERFADSLLSKACLFYDATHLFPDGICPEGVALPITRMRIEPRNPNVPQGQNGPEGIEVDAFFVQRVPIHSAPYYLTPSALIVDGSPVSGGEDSINEVNFLSCDPALWADKVHVFNDSLEIEFSEPLEPGDLIRIIRQGFPVGQAAINPTNPEDHGKICEPSGSFDLFLGVASGDAWVPVAMNISNTNDFRLFEEHFVALEDLVQ